MNILIADDERMARVTIKSMLEDLNINTEDIHEVENGSELLKALKHFTPDIAFVDIKMPLMSGLEAIKLGSAVSPNTQWVILTGFSEFEFAKQAIELGVSKYLLKPVSPEELQDTIKTLAKNNTVNFYSLNKKFERDIIALYNGFDSAKEIILESIITKAIFEAAIFYFDGDYGKDRGVNHKKSFFTELSSIIEDLLSNDVRIALFNISGAQVAAVCAYDATKNPTSKYNISTFFRRAAELGKKLNSSEFSVTIIKGSDFSDYKKINKSLGQISLLSPLRVLYGTCCMYTMERLNALNTRPDHLDSSKQILDLCMYYNEKKYLYFNNSLMKLKKELSLSGLLNNENYRKCIVSFLSISINFRVQPGDDLNSWLKSLSEHGESLLENLDIVNTDYINEITDFIADNYMYDIGINTIADTLNITPNYLSSLFHKRTKMKFIDYLTEVRILKARELLAENKLSIAEISEKVGYHSTRHFTKVFYKYTKQYPSEYKKNLKENSYEE